MVRNYPTKAGAATPTETDALLATWARWSAYRADAGLGIRRTILHRYIVEGSTAVAIRQEY